MEAILYLDFCLFGFARALSVESGRGGTSRFSFCFCFFVFMCMRVFLSSMGVVCMYISVWNLASGVSAGQNSVGQGSNALGLVRYLGNGSKFAIMIIVYTSVAFPVVVYEYVCKESAHRESRQWLCGQRWFVYFICFLGDLNFRVWASNRF